MTFGILTMATPNDYQKAIGLGLSARVSNPGIPTAIACSPRVRPLVAPYFDYVVDEDPTLRGFVHKVHLDRYSPFEETFFFDSDVLLFRPLSDVIETWRGQPYTACGQYAAAPFSSFGLDRKRVLQKINKQQFAEIDGAGHAYFRKPECSRVFELAREVTARHAEYAGPIPYADEDVIDIAMTMLDLKPRPHDEFFSRHLSGKKGTMRMNAARGECVFIAVTTGKEQRPHMMHFAANEAPFAYAAQLRKLFKHFGVPMDGLMRAAVEDYFVTEIKWPLKRFVKRIVVSG